MPRSKVTSCSFRPDGKAELERSVTRLSYHSSRSPELERTHCHGNIRTADVCNSYLLYRLRSCLGPQTQPNPRRIGVAGELTSNPVIRPFFAIPNIYNIEKSLALSKTCSKFPYHMRVIHDVARKFRPKPSRFAKIRTIILHSLAPLKRLR